MKNYLSPIEHIIKEAKIGKMFILVDAEDRENEGDLVIPAIDARPPIPDRESRVFDSPAILNIASDL